MNYVKGRRYEEETVRMVNKHSNWFAIRKHLSGQGGGEDVKLILSSGDEELVTLLAEQKVKARGFDSLYKMKKNNDLLIVKKIGRTTPRLVILDFEMFLTLVGQLSDAVHKLGSVSNKPIREDGQE